MCTHIGAKQSYMQNTYLCFAAKQNRRAYLLYGVCLLNVQVLLNL